jgi:hypothetical protein
MRRQATTYARTTLILILSLTLANPLGLHAQQLQPSTQAALARIDLMMRGLEELQKTIDRRQFDVSALALELSMEEPEKIVDYVRNHIAFEQYPGLLRGPKGTLMSRAGNALDQAVLLAHLLKDAGYDARVVLGRIPEADASRLLDEMRHERPEPPPFADFDAMADVLRKVERELGAREGALSNLLDSFLAVSEDEDTYGFAQDVRNHADAILEALDSAAVSLGAEGWRDALVAEARHYAWVEYRPGAGTWLRAHPAFHDAALDPDEPEVITTFTETVPPDLLHRLRVESVIERRAGDNIVEHAVMSPWEVPVANLVGIPVTYWNMPDGYTDPDDLLNVDASTIVEATQMFFPVLMGSVPEGAQAFDLLGNVAPPGEASSPMAGIFRTTGEAASRAASALSELSAAQPAEKRHGLVGLVAQRLRFTLVAPNGEETVYERRLEAVPGDRQGSIRAVATQRVFMVSAGTLSDGFVFDRLLERVIASKPLLQLAVVQEIDADATVEPDFSGVESSTFAWPGHLLLYQAFDRPSLPDTEAVSYRDAPSLVLRHYDVLPLDGLGSDVIDVVTNSRRSFSWVDDEFVVNPSHSVQRGVWETHAEGIFSAADSNTFSTMVALRGNDGGIKPLTVVAPDRSGDVDGLAPDELTRANMLRDLRAGYLLVAPADAKLASRTGWWRVDPLTGETLGIVSGGWGGDLINYAALFDLAVAALVPVIVGVATTVTCRIIAKHAVGAPKTISCTTLGVTVGRLFVGPTGWLAFGFVMGIAGIAGLEPAPDFLL